MGLMTRAMWTGCAVLVALLAGEAGAQDDIPFAQVVQEYQASIAELGKYDPQHPDVLAATLDLANYLATAPGKDCERLASARQQLAVAAASPVTRFALPDGAGRLETISYQIQSRLAGCIEDEERQGEILRRALEHAQRAVSLLEQAFDYHAMVYMQFNTAAAHRQLGEDEQAIAALEKAIALGRAHGMRADVEENYAILLDWRDGKEDPQAVARYMRDVPADKVTFRFGWPAGGETRKVDLRNAQLLDGKASERSGSFTMHIDRKRQGGNWLVDTTVPPGGFAVAVPGAQEQVNRKLTEFLGRLVSDLPVMVIGPTGEFQSIPELAAFSKQLSQAAQQYVDELFADSAPTLKDRAAQHVNAAIGALADPDVLEGKAREEYALESGLWIDATLEHGEAYEMPMMLTMPGTPNGFLEHDLRFTVSSHVPCAAGGPPRCVEIIGLAQPAEKPLAAVVQEMSRTRKDLAPWEYWARTRFRIVTDPQTLITYSRDVRQYSYIGYASRGQRAQEIKTERQVMTATPNAR